MRKIVIPRNYDEMSFGDMKECMEALVRIIGARSSTESRSMNGEPLQEAAEDLYWRIGAAIGHRERGAGVQITTWILEEE